MTTQHMSAYVRINLQKDGVHIFTFYRTSHAEISWKKFLHLTEGL